MRGSEFDPSGLTALVLDANHYERGITLDLLRGMGFGRVIAADKVEAAWEALHKDKPDIIFIEWLDSAESGLSFAKRIRTTDTLPNRAAPIFMLTARGAQAEVERARLSGVDGFLRKPISRLALQKRVRVVMTAPQPFIVTATYVGPCRRRRRSDLNYLGPRRRLDDPALAHDNAEQDDVKANVARASVAALEARAALLQPGDAKSARDVYRAAQDLIDTATQLNDSALLFGAKEMSRYLQAQGATERLDAEVVRTHVAALHQLAHLPSGMFDERDRVAQSLKRMVDKKLRQANAA